MAIYISNTANLFEITSKTASNGKEYVTCNVVFYSKSKDKEGEFTIKDEPFKVKAIAFGKNADFLKSIKDDKAFVNLKGKLYSAKYEKDGEMRYINKLDIISVSEFVSASGDVSDDVIVDIEDDDVPF